MKKKHYILLIILILILLPACGNDGEAAISNEVKEPPKYEFDVSDDVPAQSKESSDNTDSITDEYLATTFEMPSSDIAKIIYGNEVDSFSKNIGGYDIDVFPYENYFLFCVTSEGQAFPSLIYAYDQARSGTSTSSIALIQPFFDVLPEYYDAQINSYSIEDSIISCIWLNGSEPKNLPITLKLVPDTDYFLYADIEEYQLACSEGRYDDIFTDVQSYIKEVNPPSYDNAYILESVLSPIMEDWNNIDVQYDSVEKHASFFYSSVSNISNSIHFVPYATTYEKKISALMGFYDSDWLFFENIVISSEDNIRISASRNKIEDVVHGGSIYEAYVSYLDDEDIENLLSHPNHTIRFEARNGTFKDYEMSEEEYKALNSIAKFYNVRNILSDLCFHFQNRMP